MEKDNYQILLQQYKSIQGQLASLKQEEELLNEISLSDKSDYSDQDKYEQKNLAEGEGKGKIGNKQGTVSEQIETENDLGDPLYSTDDS